MVEAADFVDHCTIFVRGGKGGNGSVSNRREAHVPRGGPDGGDGGRGGDVVFVADLGTTSLLDLHRAPHRRGDDGAHGAGMQKTGKSGQDEVIRVPVGTIVRDKENGEILVDLVRDGQRAVLAAGGRGGRGNATFANRHRRLPRFAEFGEVTYDRAMVIDLKLIADVGLVGFPSAGKSSLITKVSAARPRIEAWPFTTLTPHLGVVRAGDDGNGRPIDIILADVPGLIEGASDGKGLGHRFLRHIERCRVLLHVLDAAPFDLDRDPISDLAILREELRRHDAELLTRPQVVVLNKLDLPDGQAMSEMVKDTLEAAGETVYEISALTGEGLDTLRYALGRMVAEARVEQPILTQEDEFGEEQEVIIRLAGRRRGPDFTIQVDEDGTFLIHGDRIQRWVQMLPLAEPQAMRFLQGRLTRAGVEKALIKAGARTGDDVMIGEMVFEFDPDKTDLPEEERLALEADEALDEAERLGVSDIVPGNWDHLAANWDDDGGEAGDGA